MNTSYCFLPFDLDHINTLSPQHAMLPLPVHSIPRVKVNARLLRLGLGSEINDEKSPCPNSLPITIKNPNCIKLPQVFALHNPPIIWI